MILGYAALENILWKTVPEWDFLTTRTANSELLVLLLNNLPMPNSATTQISKVKEPASFWNFQNRKSCVVNNVRHFVANGVVCSFLRNFWKIKADLSKKSYHISKLIIGYLWAKCKGFSFFNHAPHFFLISRGLRGHSLLTLVIYMKYSTPAFFFPISNHLNTWLY